MLAAVTATAVGLAFGVSAGAAGDSARVISLLSVQQGGSLIDVDRSGGERANTRRPIHLHRRPLPVARHKARQAHRDNPRHRNDHLTHDRLLHRNDVATRRADPRRGLFQLHRTRRDNHRARRNRHVQQRRRRSHDHKARRRELQQLIARDSTRSIERAGSRNGASLDVSERTVSQPRWPSRPPQQRANKRTIKPGGVRCRRSCL